MTLQADLSQWFGHRLCDGDGLHSDDPNRAQTQRGAAGEEGSDCKNNENLNRDLFHTDLYACPERKGHVRTTGSCGGIIGDYYCKKWGCETMVSPPSWTPGAGKDPHIITRDRSSTPGNKENPRCAQDRCNPVTVTILDPSNSGWEKGRTWGLCLHTLRWNPGVLFTIRRVPQAEGPVMKGFGSGLPPRPSRPLISPPKVPSRPGTPTPESPSGTPRYPEPAP